ncbi:MAG: histone deacetylase [Microthrixaceae bacterium]
MVLAVTDAAVFAHETGPGHPESTARAVAAVAALDDPVLREQIVRVPTAAAPIDALVAVHDPGMVDRLLALRGCAGSLDADTTIGPDSVDAALRAAGSGLVAIDALRRDGGERHRGAFCVVRPPGHHATSRRPMGFCLFNNLAVATRSLVDSGERVLVADFDAHHGNGTQEIFWNEPRVLFVSWHQSPLYPNSGGLDEIGGPDAMGSTVNVPIPAGSTGGVVRDTIESVIGRIVEGFRPTWLLVSAGFDAHHADPLTDLGFSDTDFGAITAMLSRMVDPGRVVAFLEGGYDLEALGRCVASTVGALAGERLGSEPETIAGPAARNLVRSVECAQGLR